MSRKYRKNKIGEYIKQGIEDEYIPNDEELLEIPKGTVRANGEQIAKAIGGHIPERVLDDGLLTPNELKNMKHIKLPVEECKHITIPVEEYKELIGNESFAAGRIYELEKQLEELKRPVETITKNADGKPYKAIEESTCPPIEIKTF